MNTSAFTNPFVGNKRLRTLSPGSEMILGDFLCDFLFLLCNVSKNSMHIMTNHIKEMNKKEEGYFTKMPIAFLC